MSHHSNTGKITKVEKPEFEVTPLLQPFIRELRKSDDPRDQVLAQLAESSDLNRQETQWQSPLLIQTDYQSRKTNGRVTRIEYVIVPLVLLVIILLVRDPESIAWLVKFLVTLGGA